MYRLRTYTTLAIVNSCFALTLDQIRIKLIEFVATIVLDSKNWDQKVNLNTIEIWLKPITIPKLVQSPKLTLTSAKEQNCFCTYS